MLRDCENKYVCHRFYISRSARGFPIISEYMIAARMLDLSLSPSLSDRVRSFSAVVVWGCCFLAGLVLRGAIFLFFSIWDASFCWASLR